MSFVVLNCLSVLGCIPASMHSASLSQKVFQSEHQHGWGLFRASGNPQRTIPMRVGVGALKVGTRPAASSSFTNERTVAEKIHHVQILFWVPLPGGCLGGISPDLYPQKNIPPPPTFKFCSPGVQHTVYPLWDSYLLVLGGGVLVYQGFLFLKGSRRDFFR